MNSPTAPRTLALALVVGVVLVAAATGGGTLAGFVDSEELDAEIGAGSFDVRLSEVGSATADGTTDERNASTVTTTWADYSHATNGTDAVNNTLAIELTSVSSPSNSVALDVALAENDTASGTANNTNATAKTLEVVAFEYNGTELVGSRITDANGNGIVDLHDAARADLGGLDGLRPGEPVELRVSISGDAGLEGGVGAGDGVDVTVTVQTEVEDSWEDAGTSGNNTIQYAES